MVAIGSWNVRGLNTPHKQFAVRSWLKHHNLDIFGLLETKITYANLARVQNNLLPTHWATMSNIQASPICRIMVGWNSQICHLQCIDFSGQWITCEVQKHPCLSGTKITFVYGSNDYGERRDLWRYILAGSGSHQHHPWAILGDFNAVLRPSDRSGGISEWKGYQDDFPNCMMQSSLQQAPFKFLNQWAAHEDFLHIVQRVWVQHIAGNPLFQLTTKLNILKQHFREKHLNSTSHLSHRVWRAKVDWVNAQKELDADPLNRDLGDRERHLAKQRGRRKPLSKNHL
ncbi:hypothetical protein OIU78_017543 [Salix suchowensis]|nr:hypothetical protein OIU78_017543 [Salix suchowensis]